MITETLIKIAKFTGIVVCCAVFLVAINVLLGALSSWLSTTFVGEFFGLVSMYLPFNPYVVFNSVLFVCTIILGFLVSNKIFNLTSWSINSV